MSISLPCSYCVVTSISLSATTKCNVALLRTGSYPSLRSTTPRPPHMRRTQVAALLHGAPPAAPSLPHHPHLPPVPFLSATLPSPGCTCCLRRAGCWLHSASAALRRCGCQPRCRLSACSARWRSSRYRLRCAHQPRRSACRALTAQRGRLPGGLASPRASWSMRSRSGQASRRRRPSWC